jgi:late competence protein required for DNA uptake (superfamily II DNA/RNA helicase)
LKRTRNVKSIEIITPEVSIASAQDILKGVYGTSSVFGKLINSQEYLINSALRKFNINKVQRKITEGAYIPSNEDICRLEEHITGRIVTLAKLILIGKNMGFNEEQIINIIQSLYCERRIKLMPAVKRKGNKNFCTACNKEVCSDCCMGFNEEDILLYAADNYNLNKSKNIHVSKEKVTEVIKIARDGFYNFIKSKRSNGILWCAPNSFEYDSVFYGIAEVVKKGGRVLYAASTFITNEALAAMTEALEGAKVDIIYGSEPDYKKNDVCICSYSEFPCFYKAFDLVILDQRFAFLEKPIQNLVYIYQKAVKEKGKFLNITCYPGSDKRSFFRSSPEIISIPVTYRKNPIPEPRIITSRFLKGAEAFFPQIVMDVIKWSMEENARIIIFVPSEGEVHKVYYYLTNIEGIDRDMIDVSYKKDKAPLLRFKRGELQILISMDIKDSTHIIEDLNIIVMNSDDIVYRVDTLINIAAMASRGTDKKLREVMFVATQENERLSLAKTTIRNINRISWEMGYIKR